jgi:CBS domain-containing protein
MPRNPEEGLIMVDEKRIKDIMTPIEEYEKIGVDDALCSALAILKGHYEKKKTDPNDKFHKTLFVTDDSGNIIGKINMFDIIKGLIPEGVKKPEMSRAIFSMFSSKVEGVADTVGDLQKKFKWLNSTFLELVKQVAHKKIGDIMSPVYLVLGEDDTINSAVFIMFKENIRQPLVVKEGKTVGVVDLMAIFSELLEIAGPECYVHF